jgi:hypothetical protein
MSKEPNTRISPPDWPKEISALQRLAAAEVAGVQEFQNKVAAAFCDVAIHTWRMQRRMTDRVTKEVKEEHKTMYRSVAGILEALTGMGFTVRDREGDFYDYGLPEKVVAAEKRAGISREMVVETIRPSIFYGDQLLKPGEIVIAVPEDAHVNAPAPNDGATVPASPTVTE